MKLRDFLKDEILKVTLITFGIITIEIFLSVYKIGLFIKIYIPVIIIGLYFIRNNI